MKIKELFWELTHKNYIVKNDESEFYKSKKNTMNITNYWKTKSKTTIYKNAIVSMAGEFDECELKKTKREDTGRRR